MSPLPTDVLIALGSNLGDRRHRILNAIERLVDRGAIQDCRLSNLHETDAVGGPRQGPFLNAVLMASTRFDPHVLLETLLRVEQEMGRTRDVKNGPRTLDLDLIFYGDRVIDSLGLTVPHPRCHERAFVLIPAAEVSPDWIHPVLGKSLIRLRDSLVVQTLIVQTDHEETAP